jgi:hypothetical protein
MSWQKITLSTNAVANGDGSRLQHAFSELFMIAAAPIEAGMFGSKDVGRNDYFFSPEASRLAQSLILSFGGIFCDPPRRSDVIILVAHEGAPQVPFAP